MQNEFDPLYEKLLNQPYIIPETNDERETLEALCAVGQVSRLTCPYEHYRITKAGRIALSQIDPDPKSGTPSTPCFNRRYHEDAIKGVIPLCSGALYSVPGGNLNRLTNLNHIYQSHPCQDFN